MTAEGWCSDRPDSAGLTSSQATTSLVLGVLSVCLTGFLTGVPAMVISRRAHHEIRASQGRLGGASAATLGFWTGFVGTVWSLLGLALVVVMFVLGVALFSHIVSQIGITGCSSRGVSSSCP